MKQKNITKMVWNYLKQDTWHSWLVSLIILYLIIRFIFFPTLSFVTGSALPLVVVESCSMYHSSDLDSWWQSNSGWYEQQGITLEEFKSFPLKNGLNKGDILFIYGKSEYEKGDIIVFAPNEESTAKNPIIHRIVIENPTGTKGDNGRTNPTQLTANNNIFKIDETSISDERIIGKTAFKVAPLVGWVKLIFFEPFRSESQRGFCK